MIKDVFISGETIIYFVKNSKNSTIYFTLKRKKESTTHEIQKKIIGIDDVNEVVLSGSETWNLLGDYIGEFFVVFDNGERIALQRHLSFEKRLLNELW